MLPSEDAIAAAGPIANPDTVPESLQTFLAKCAERYCWDMSPEDAVRRPDRVLLRTMNIGTWEDTLDLERIAGRDLLIETLAGASCGALSGRAWSFWHYRLGLTDVNGEPPPQPRRLPKLRPTRALGYVLYGGTAAALQLGHRQSVDFDFFEPRPSTRGA